MLIYLISELETDSSDIFDFSWILGVWMVLKCSSEDLLERLKRKGARDPELTRKMIIEKLNDTDLEVSWKIFHAEKERWLLPQPS